MKSKNPEIMVDIIINMQAFLDIGVTKEHMYIDAHIAAVPIPHLAVEDNITSPDSVQHIMVVRPVSLSVQPIILHSNLEHVRQQECII